MNLINLKNVVWKFLKSLASLNFSIFILLLICFFSMLGTLIEQDESLNYYQKYYPMQGSNIFFINWKLITYLGLDHLYQAWWFILSIIIFSASLIICTFSVQFPSLKNSRRWKFFSPQNEIDTNKSIHNFFSKYNHSVINIIYSLVYYNFYVFHKKNCIYAYKGLLGRIAPIFVHFSIIITLLGFILSSFFGYTIQEMIPKNETFHMKNVVRSGFYSSLNKNLSIRVDNFFINYNLDSSIQQFFSNLYLINNQIDFITHKVISVNKPLVFKGLTIYQTDWQIDALRLKLGYNNLSLIQKKLIKLNINNKVCWISTINIDENKKIFFILFNLKDNILISNANGSIILNVSLNQKFYVNDTAFCIKDIMLNTGLQIKVDPGISVIYLGFFMLMISTLVSYISYSEIWVNLISNVFNFASSTNRSVFFFEEDIIKINKFYSYHTFAILLNNEKNYFRILKK
uniref:Cytochrome c biogenesis protein Ccs1 n=1 Tax=Thuretia quercifolia TaxID=189650 RepID=A0A1Z1MK81_9FLOR|nr:cytochrome c biogenesis protein ccs1 [Thuretia quercifolia]ARW66346.1 cytochrome c biogenesis protein ccs1 [Thuretia quercifolia]